MKIWLIQLSARDRYYNEEESISKFDSYDSALNYVGSVAKGELEDVRIHSVHSVDFNYSPPLMTSNELVLENFRLELKEKK